jgi:Xaa-Pro dipeptidase
VAGIVERVRLTKSAAEVDVLRQAARITAAGVEAAVRVIRVGARDFDVAAETNRALLAGGSLYMSSWPFICGGWRGGTPHSNASGYTLAPGDTVFLEMGGTVARYTTPIMRTVSLGKPGHEVTRLANASIETLEAVMEAMRPGVRASEVAAVGERVVSKVASDVIFHYTFGYPVGLGYPPSWMEESDFLLLKSNHEPLEAGMVFHLPMSLRVYGRRGVAFSETVHITEKGVEILTERMPRTLCVNEG